MVTRQRELWLSFSFHQGYTYSALMPNKLDGTDGVDRSDNFVQFDGSDGFDNSERFDRSDGSDKDKKNRKY